MATTNGLSSHVNDVLVAIEEWNNPCLLFVNDEILENFVNRLLQGVEINIAYYSYNCNKSNVIAVINNK
jgi:hypothetical protein